MSIPPIGPKDIIAFFAILGAVIVQLAGAADTLSALITLVVGFYFGHRKSGQDVGK